MSEHALGQMVNLLQTKLDTQNVINDNNLNGFTLVLQFIHLLLRRSSTWNIRTYKRKSKLHYNTITKKIKT